MNSSRWMATLLVSSFLIGASAPGSWAQDASQASGAGSAGATAAAVAGDVFYVPGKAIVCGMSGVLWVATMAITFGSLYQESTEFVKGGCGGRWVLTGEDIKPTGSY
jgi:hypothetical protein